MIDTPLSRTFQISFILAGLLCTFATIGVAITARMRSNSWRRWSQYVLLGGVFNFLSGISMGAFMLMDNPDLRALPMLLLLSLVWGLIGAIVVFNSWIVVWMIKQEKMNKHV